MLIRGIKSFAISAAVACAFAVPAARAETLRVCADPDNLPFSKSEGPERGLYIELAELVGKRLGAPVEYVWWLTYNQRRALRNTILQDGCDAVFALPADADYKVRGLQRTQGFLQVSYAVVAPPSFSFARLTDLKGKRVGVQVGTPPHILLSQHEGYPMSSYRTADEVFDALGKGEVDVAMLWGPIAGYENKTRFNNRWRITPVTGHGLGGQVAVGVRKGKDALAADLDRALVELHRDIQALADKYGFPRDKPIDLDLTSRADEEMRFAALATAGWRPVNTSKADAKKPAAQKGSAAKQEAAPPADPMIVAGRTRFNDQCSHCHGSDGASPVRERDLRRLKMRYDAKWTETAVTTIKNGRVHLGMPAWKDVLDEKQIDEVLGFLGTIQK